jgi:N-acetylneuraminate synthase
VSSASSGDGTPPRGAITVGDRVIDASTPPFVIAELSANHLGSKQRALDIIAAAAEAGADAVKLQHYTADTITVAADHPDLRVGGGTLWDGRQLVDLYDEATTPWEWTDELIDECRRRGVEWFSSPFSNDAVDFLSEREVSVYKIASFELVDLPLIRHAASKGRPLIMSTGMATIEEIDAAVDTALDAGASTVALLRCNSAYPAPPEAMDLRAIPVMAERWPFQIGLSDHTLGSTAAIAAVALGATIVETHLTLRREDGGPDAAFSAEPHELAELVSSVRAAHAALGRPRFGPSEAERGSLAFRRSLRMVRPVRRGEAVTPDDVASLRPAGGLPPDAIGRVVGRTATRDLAVGDPLTSEDLRPDGR